MKGAVLNGALCTMDREAQKADSCFSGSAFDPEDEKAQGRNTCYSYPDFFCNEFHVLLFSLFIYFFFS